VVLVPSAALSTNFFPPRLEAVLAYAVDLLHRILAARDGIVGDDLRALCNFADAVNRCLASGFGTIDDSPPHIVE
jgi:hypothetical protein